MSKLAKTSATPARTRGPLKATASPGVSTHQGGVGYTKDSKTELFTLAVANLVGESTFYESAGDRDERYRDLIATVTREDPEWVAAMLNWLRSEGNLRSAAIVGAVEWGRTMAESGYPYPMISVGPQPHQVVELTPRRVLNSVLQRPDEPGEALGYWLGRYGRPLPKWLKRSLGDSADRFYSPFNALKYDGQAQTVRFADVIEFSQSTGDNLIWKWLLDRRHGHEEGDYGLSMLAARRELDTLDLPSRRAVLNSPQAGETLKAAGMTWESVSGWIQGPMDAQVWESIIPLMGYMALLRNLRNFDEAGVSDEVAAKVATWLTDPTQVARSRQLPFRFYSAYKAAPSDRWKHSLGIALDMSLRNVPTLHGRTLVLIDTSASMKYEPISARSSVYPWELAALFGLALARSQDGRADVYGFDTSVREFHPNKGANTLAELKRFKALVAGGGTHTASAVRECYRPTVHDRVVVLTDQQAAYDGLGVYDSVPQSVPCYTFDCLGYATAHSATSGTRHMVAGLTDSAFRMMSLLETTKSGRWPWEQ